MKCKICNHPDRLKIEEDMQNSELSQSEIAKKYNLYPQVVSSHLPHIPYDIRGRLEELIKASLTTKVPPESIGDLARLLSEYRAFTELEDKCATCQFKTKKNRSIEQALSEFLGTGDENISINVKQYGAFVRWIENLPESDPIRKEHEATKNLLKQYHPAVNNIHIDDVKEDVPKVNEVILPKKKFQPFGEL